MCPNVNEIRLNAYQYKNQHDVYSVFIRIRIEFSQRKIDTLYYVRDDFSLCVFSRENPHPFINQTDCIELVYWILSEQINKSVEDEIQDLIENESVYSLLPDYPF